MRKSPMSLAGRLAVVVALVFTGSSRADEPAIPANHAEAMKEGLALFKEQVRPVLVKHCLDCHGGKATKGDFDLSDRKPLVDSGAIEGGAKGSQLIAVISHTEEPHMPHKAPKLPDADIARITRWVELGAPYDRSLTDKKIKALAITRPETPTDADRDFWSFRPLKPAAPPEVKNASWVKTPVDRFILAALDAKGIAPNAEADRRVLIRRLSLDLLGLPPTPEDVDAFLADNQPDAYDRLVDRLLASPRYGERWARHWMDVARFAESHGYEQDYDRPYAYHYRDFLIDALNRDIPFDRFVQWQIAGDELAPDDPQALAATGFLGAGAFPTQLTEAEFESARYNELDDMTATTGVAFLGLSVGCARCHDHKYDPIRSNDYYRMASIFSTTIRGEIDPPGLKTGDKGDKIQVTAEGFPHTKHHADDRGFPHFYPKTFQLLRGDVAQKQGEAAPGFLPILMRDGKAAEYWRADPPTGSTRSSYRRAGLARWLTDTDLGAGSLAARVIVNRLWQHHFGRGIVATPNDFGAQGEPPTHPELLDYLALDLVRNGWTLKRLHKLIVTSAVYRQDSQSDEARASLDREDAYYWRRAPQRLEAEPIRDALLFVSGRLDSTFFGPGSLDESMTRRSVYFRIKRSQLIPTMMLFDWPEHLVSIGQRPITTTAPQALMFLNSPLGRKSAEGLAARLPTENPVREAYRLCFGREPTADESRLSATFLDGQADVYRREGKADPNRLARVDLCQALMSMSEFIYVQ